MHGYVRPSVPEQVFRDEAGAVIRYGHRWGEGSPPEDSYSVNSHPERFAPLHLVAEALIAHLGATYAVDVEGGPGVAADVDRVPPAAVVRAVRLTPARADAPPLTVVLTDYPAVVVHAGLLHDFPFPGCGCDACDATWQAEADDLEELVAAVVRGRYGEWVTGWPRPWVHHAFADERGRGTRSASERASGGLARRGRAARKELARRAGPWRPWPLHT